MLQRYWLLRAGLNAYRDPEAYLVSFGVGAVSKRQSIVSKAAFAAVHTASALSAVFACRVLCRMEKAEYARSAMSVSTALPLVFSRVSCNNATCLSQISKSSERYRSRQVTRRSSILQ